MNDILISKLYQSGSIWIPEKDLSLSALSPNDVLSYNGFCTLKNLGRMETELAQMIMRLIYLSDKLYVPESVINSLLDKFEEEENNGAKLDIMQRKAVIMVVNNPISIITGGPGTGKTTVLRAVTYVLRSLYPKIRIVYTAPTGKAARRISESTHENATTLHTRLKLGIEDDKKCAKKFDEDVIFVDESSMMDLQLAHALFSALFPNQRAVLVGDVNQLPSVGIGAILRDIILSGVVPYTTLLKTFRQDNSSTLFENIQNIRDGKVDLINGSDFNSICMDGVCMKDISCKLIDLYKSSVMEYGLENVALLLPYRKWNDKVISSEVINPCLQSVINPNKQSGMGYGTARNKFFVGDLVMQLENRKECVNGEIGTVVNIDGTGMFVDYHNGCIVKYTMNNLKEITLAYSMSIHKSQGSEYPCVIMCLLDKHRQMLNNNLVYTGVTRAKKKCILAYQSDALNVAIKTKADKERYSMLADKLKQLDILYRAA